MMDGGGAEELELHFITMSKYVTVFIVFSILPFCAVVFGIGCIPFTVEKRRCLRQLLESSFCGSAGE